MNLKRCGNGHFYDADKFSTCPHCNSTVSAAEVTVAMSRDNMAPEVSAAAAFGGPESRTVSLQEAISSAVADAPGAPAQASAAADDVKTVGYYMDAIGIEPVVGWLVCIEGDHYGKSFPLKSGRNMIGRNPDMDVALTGDMSVSRERHAIVIYEPRAKCFIAQAGDARELAYLNDQILLSNLPLNTRDILSVGNERLLFVALCGPEFCWEDTQKKNQ